MDDSELLRKRFSELANKSYNAGIYLFTDFLGLAEQAINAEVGLYATEELMKIFGIQKNELPPEVEEEIEDSKHESGEDGSDEEDDDEKGDSGGYGSGEVVFGSDDLIYYPDEEAYVKYGEVINEYYARIMEKIKNGVK